MLFMVSATTEWKYWYSTAVCMPAVLDLVGVVIVMLVFPFTL